MVFLVCVFGLIVGSFLNALIYRLSTASRSIFEKHSICPKCKHELAWPDLIPLVSFFILRGKCRYCGKLISWQYPAVELATGVAFVLIASNFQFSMANYQSIFNFQFWIQIIFACFLIVIFVYDLKHYLILDKVIFPGAVLALGYQAYRGELGNALIGAALLAVFFGLLYLVSHGRWIGFGDVKLGLFLGLLVPWPATLVLFFIAYMSGALVSLVLLVWGGKKMTDRLPFGTFLTFAAFCAMLWGEELVKWYIKLIGL